MVSAAPHRKNRLREALIDLLFYTRHALPALVIAVACLLLPGLAFSQQTPSKTPHPPIVYVTDEEYAPYAFVENGKPAGFCVELMQAVGKVIGRDVRVSVKPWKEILPAVKRGEVDVTDGVAAEERGKEFDYSLPIAQVHYILFVRKGSAIRTIDDAKGKKLIVEDGDFIESYLKRTNFTRQIYTASSPLKELRLLNSSDYDGAFAPRAQGLYYIKKYKLKNIEASEAGFESINYAFIVKKGNADLVRDIDEGLDVLKQNGTYAKLYEKWFGVYEQVNVYERLKYFFYALAIIAILFVVSSILLWILRRQIRLRTAELAGEVERRREAEEALAARGRELQNYIDRLTTLNAKLAPDATVLAINATAARIAKKPVEEIVGMKLWETPLYAHSEEMRDRVEAAVKEAACGNDQRLEVTHPGAGGKDVQIDLTLTAVCGNDGQVLYIVAEGNDVTARKQAEEAFLESARMMRLVLDTIPVRVFWKDMNIVYQGGNRTFAEDAGLASPDELAGKTDYEMPWPHQAENYRSDDRAVIESGKSKLDYDEIQTTRSGRDIWVRTSKIPLRDANGETIGVLGIYEDITPRKLAEQALKNSEKQLATIIDFLPDPTFAIDLEGRVTLWNRAVEKLTGVKAKNIIGKGDYEYGLAVYGQRRPMIIDLVGKSIPDGEKRYIHIHRENGALLAEAHTPLVRPEGAYLWGKASTLYDPDGNVTGYIETLRDVTDRTLTEQALKESEEKFRALAENAETMIFIFRDGKFLYTNPFFSDITGFTENELLAMDVPMIIHPNFQTAVTDHLNGRLAGESLSCIEEFMMLGKDGREIWVDLTATRIEYRGKPAVVGVGYDVTERRKAESEKRAFYRETIRSATDGKLDISDMEDLEAYETGAQLTKEVHDHFSLGEIRSEIEKFCVDHKLPAEKLDNFMIGIVEAIDNAVKHAGSGRVFAGADEERLWVRISDSGPGIESLVLPKAVLRRGFSTKPSLGLGYSIILQVADRILLSTGKTGTTVVMMANLREEHVSLLDSIPDTWAGVADLR
ncbi:MAG TPA: PAS domain S-box protein [Armatimonadota bacterium]